MTHHDVIVVGTGVAGLTAAVRLAESGARVLVLAKGVGATHLSAGTVDVLGYAPERVERPAAALPAFLAEHPDHPYAHVGVDGIATAVAWFKDRIANGSLAPYAYAGSVDENLLLPTALGVPRPSAIVPETMAGGDLRAGGPVVVAGFRAFRDGDRLRGVRVRVGLREERLGADWVVIATGGFASGGLELDSRWAAREPALGLPLHGVPGPGEERFRPEYFAAQPMARAGVAVDGELRPVDPSGARVLENVLVAGATLAGAEPWKEKSGEGISLATGHRAAELVLAASARAAAPAATSVESS